MPICSDPNCPNKRRVEELEAEVRKLKADLYAEKNGTTIAGGSVRWSNKKQQFVPDDGGHD